MVEVNGSDSAMSIAISKNDDYVFVTGTSAKIFPVTMISQQ
jgi:hypothetical protein